MVHHGKGGREGHWGQRWIRKQLNLAWFKISNKWLIYAGVFLKILSNSTGGKMADCLYLSVACTTDSLELSPTNSILKEKKPSKHKEFRVQNIYFGTP